MTVGLIVTGGMIALAGYLVKYQWKEHWLAGYDASRIEDPKAVADFFGGHLLAIGLIGLIPGLLSLWVEMASEWQPYVMMAYVVLVIVWIMAVSLAGKRFEKSQSVHSDQENEHS